MFRFTAANDPVPPGRGKTCRFLEQAAEQTSENPCGSSGYSETPQGFSLTLPAWMPFGLLFSFQAPSPISLTASAAAILPAVVYSPSEKPPK